METLRDPKLKRKLASEHQSAPPLIDQSTLAGYALLAFSAGLYGVIEYFDLGRDDLTLFFIHYFIALAFVIILIVNKSYGLRKCWRKEHIHKTAILMNLFLVSAYALNRSLPVFEDAVPWLCVYLLLSSAVMMSYLYFNRLPRVVNALQHVLMGSALVLYFYMSVYVANFYVFGTIGIILFGIGAHIFLPLLLLAVAIRLLFITREKRRVSLAWVATGAFLTFGFAVGFMVEWNARVKAIDRLANQSVLHADTDLPVWLKVAATLKNDWITERILKSRLVYSVSNEHFQWDLFPVDGNWDEQRKHDPLVFIASGNSSSALSDEDRKNILKAITDSRHRAHERLWSGDNLTTSYLVSDADIYPELRMAYSEHYVNVRNSSASDNRWWGNSQEAIYTFYLSEGSIVTSLSLWVNGKEEKAILTSKQKATEVYTTIVGREMRDPSVVHWQEGNTVSVRVFPCTPEEERKFKIGITSPLTVVGNEVVYHNVTFRGPDASDAMQTSRIRIIGKPEQVSVPDGFSMNRQGEYFREGEYAPELAITMDLMPIGNNQFSFDGFTYSVSDASAPMCSVEFRNVYLDINNSWTSEEIEALRPLLEDYSAHVYVDNDFATLSPLTWRDLTTTLKQKNFSLFPFHHIRDTEKSLVITKGKTLSPHLGDFKGSTFADGISEYFASGRKVYVFNLEGGASTYVKSLKELRAFHFSQGDIETLSDILRTRRFPVMTESEDRVVLHESNMVIDKKAKVEDRVRDNAPDHLARLFAYNNIMRQVGVHLFSGDFVNDRLVDEARMAYVVSPVSSLIVLETKEDYERFGIEDLDKSLHNAAKKSAGGVPEPHEWALIIVFLLFIAFYMARYTRLKLLLIRK